MIFPKINLPLYMKNNYICLKLRCKSSVSVKSVAPGGSLMSDSMQHHSYVQTYECVTRFRRAS